MLTTHNLETQPNAHVNSPGRKEVVLRIAELALCDGRPFIRKIAAIHSQLPFLKAVSEAECQCLIAGCRRRIPFVKKSAAHVIHLSAESYSGGWREDEPDGCEMLRRHLEAVTGKLSRHSGIEFLNEVAESRVMKAVGSAPRETERQET